MCLHECNYENHKCWHESTEGSPDWKFVRSRTSQRYKPASGAWITRSQTLRHVQLLSVGLRNEIAHQDRCDNSYRHTEITQCSANLLWINQTCTHANIIILNSKSIFNSSNNLALLRLKINHSKIVKNKLSTEILFGALLNPSFDHSINSKSTTRYIILY